MLIFTLPAYAAGSESSSDILQDKPEVRVVEREGMNGTLSHPALMNLEKFDEQEAINLAILDEVAQWNCEGAPDTEKLSSVYFNATSKVRLFDKNILSYTVNLDYHCGAGVPVKQTEGRNFNLETGTKIILEDIFKPTFYDEADQKGLTHTLVENHTFKTKDCAKSYTDSTRWNFYLTEHNIVFLPYVATLSGSCVEEIPMTLEDMKPFIFEGSMIYDMI